MTPITPTSQTVHTFPVTTQPATAPQQVDFDALTEQLAPSKKEETLQKLRTLYNKEEVISNLLHLADTRDYVAHASLFLDPDFEYYALAAVQENKLSAMQFGTLQFVRAGITGKVQTRDIQAIPLFDGEAPSTQAWNAIRDTFSVPRMQLRIDLNELLPRFFDLMRKAPSSEQYFVLIPDQCDPKHFDIGQAVNQTAHFNVFCRLEDQGKKLRMIPSLGMIQALLDATGKDGFHIKPVLGESIPESLRLSMLNESAREFCIHCEQISPAPSTADLLI